MKCHRVQHLIACVTSQEERLLTNGKIRQNADYDTSDPFIHDTHSDEKLQPGSLVMVLGTREVCTYVESVAENLHNIRDKGSARRVFFQTLLLPFCLFRLLLSGNENLKTHVSPPPPASSLSRKKLPSLCLFQTFYFLLDLGT